MAVNNEFCFSLEGTPSDIFECMKIISDGMSKTGLSINGVWHSLYSFSWEQIKDKVMYDILRDKFSSDPNKANLLATGNRPLIEGNNWHDNYWGVCSCERCKRKYNHGRNQLGKTLMQIRDELRKKDELWEE